MSTASHHHAPTSPAPPVVRTPTAFQQLELRGLARRLGETVPEQPVLVAVVEGQVAAALSERSGVVIFDGRVAGPEVRDALRAGAARRG